MVVTSPEGQPILERVVRPGQYVIVPGGVRLRLVEIGWYSRLSIVDDPTIPFIYGSMIVAMLGLTLSLVARQQSLIATVFDGPNGTILAMDIHLWGSAPARRGEIESELALALRSDEKESTP